MKSVIKSFGKGGGGGGPGEEERDGACKELGEKIIATDDDEKELWNNFRNTK